MSQFLMPVSYVYNPIPQLHPAQAPFQSDSFRFLTDSSDRTQGALSQHSIPISPEKVHVAWLSTLPGCRQCKYWVEAEASARALLDILYKNRPQVRGQLPSHVNNDRDDYMTQKNNELLSASLLSAIYMLPGATATRIGPIAQTMLLVFLHDDIVEASPSDAADTPTYDLVQEWCASTDISTSSSVIKNPILACIANDILREDQELGGEMLRGILSWVQHTQSLDHLKESAPMSLESYLTYRSKDIAYELLVAQVKFAYNLHLGEDDLEPLQALLRLWSDHLSLMNDLYSYDKEKSDYEVSGGVIINAVYLLCQLLRIPETTAKALTQTLITDLESRISEEFRRLEKIGKLNGLQRAFAEGLIACAAGHIFYSATCRRFR